MNKLTKLLMESFLWNSSTADNDWYLLSDEEQEIFEDKETFDIVLRECRIALHEETVQ